LSKLLPETPDDDEKIGGDAHVAADEAADHAEVERVADVVDDGEDELDAVEDEGDCCQHDPGNQQASLALSCAMDEERGDNDVEDADDEKRDHHHKCESEKFVDVINFDVIIAAALGLAKERVVEVILVVALAKQFGAL